ncbi:MAG: aminotransferase class V-fold PLP-dependent enzyme, partial [Clostridia bacterium]|nr:aminotransferase class V-fold PLP-dependent enzyme [Clostridia bacterium]
NGVGALWVKKGTRLSPVAFGGKQEKGMRSGTENLAGIAGFAKAAEIKFANLEADAQKMAKLKDRLISTLKSTIENVVVNSPEDSVCSVANISFPGVKSEVLLHVLESHGIYVSTGSACNSKKNKFSYVLSEMKLGANVIDSAIRFSFSAFNTTDEIDYVCKVLESEIPLLRKIMR